MSGVAAPALDPAQADLILQQVASSLKVVLNSPQRAEPGQPVTASLVPSSPEVDASDLVNGVLDVAWTSKDVRYPNVNPTNVPSTGDISGDVMAGATGATAPGVGGTGVSGLLGQVFGTVSAPRLKVRVELTWVVRDENGVELSEEKRDFLAQDGVGSPNVSLVFPPIFEELRLDTTVKPPSQVRCLSARVRLSIGNRSLGPVEVGSVPVVVLPLLIPTVVAMFSEPNYGVTHDGSVLIFVPEHSPFAGAEPLFKTLRKIESVVDALSGIGGFASFLLGLSL